MRRNSLFSHSEEQVLNLLWEKGEPLSIVEIEGLCVKEKLSRVTIFKAVQTLLDAGLLAVNGFAKSTKTYARRFIPAITREQYAAMVLEEKGYSAKDMGNIVVAMLGSGKSGKISKKTSEKAIKELEDIISQLKNTEK